MAQEKRKALGKRIQLHTFRNWNADDIFTIQKETIDGVTFVVKLFCKLCTVTINSMDLGDISQSSSSNTQGESEGPCLIVQDSQKEQDIPGTSHKQRMLWEMTALQGDRHISPVLEQVKKSTSEKDAEKKDTSKDVPPPVVATTSPVASASSVATTSPGTQPMAPLPWTITKMPSIPPMRQKDSNSSSSMGSVYPASSHDTSFSSHGTLTSSSLNSSDSFGQGAGKKTSPQMAAPKSVSTRTRSHKSMQVIKEKSPTEENISSSQEDMFGDTRTETKDYSKHPLVGPLIGTPSETIPSLQLSGKVLATDTASSDSSVNIIFPSPEAWGPVPVCIPSTPTSTPEGLVYAEEEPMEVSLDYSEGDIQPEEGIVIGETQQQPPRTDQPEEQMVEETQQQTAVEETQRATRKTDKVQKTRGKGFSEGSLDDMRVPEWQQALDREAEIEAAAASGTPGSESNTSRSNASSENQSDQWAQQSESVGGQNIQQHQMDMVTTDESARSRPASTKSLLVQEKDTTTTSQKEKPAEQPEIDTRDLEHEEPTEPQFSQDLFNPEIPPESEEPSVQILSQGEQPKSQHETQQSCVDKSEKPTSDDWDLHLTPSQTQTQSQGIYLTKEASRSQLQASMERHDDKPAVQAEATTARQDDSIEAVPKMASGGGSQWDESIVRSAPKQSESIDPSQLSEIGFHLSVPHDSGLRPVTSETPPLDKRKKEIMSRQSRQPRHSTPITEEDSQGKDQGDTPTGVKVQQPTTTLTLEEAVETQTQDSNDLPKFRLEKPVDTDQLVKTAKESPIKRSASVFARVQQKTKDTSESKGTSKQRSAITASNEESEDPFALPLEVKRSKSVENRQVVQTEQAEVGEHHESAMATWSQPPDPESRLVEGQSNEQEDDDEATIPMVYNDPPSVTVEEKSRKTSNKSKKRGRKGGYGSKKRKKPGKGDSATAGLQDPSSSVDQPAAKQSRVERDPYEWTESQSNKTPTPMKTRRGGDGEEEMRLSRRRLNEPEKGKTDVIPGTAGEGTSAKKSAAGDGKEGAPMDTTPSKGDGDGQESPSNQNTPPVRRDDDEPTQPSSGGGESSPEDRNNQTVGRTYRQVTTIIRRTIVTSRVVTEKVFEDGKLIDCIVHETIDDPITERIVEESFSPSLGSSNTSASLTSGSLADISSLSTSKSSNDTPSLQKSSSSSSSNLTKTSSTISSISHADSSLGKEISSGSPGSNKTSPNTSKGSATPGSPKLKRSVSFQDEQGGHSSKSVEKTGASDTDRTIQRTSLTRAATLPSPPLQSPQEQRLTRSGSETLLIKSASKSTGKKSIFSKTYSTPGGGKRGLRMRSSGESGKKERKKTAAKDDGKDSDEDHEERGRRPQRRQRRSGSSDKNGAKSPIFRSDEQSPPTTLPTTPLHTDAPVAGQSLTIGSGGGTRSETTTSTSAPLSSLSKSSSSKGEILATPPHHDPESPGTDISRHQLAPGTRVLAKWLDSYYYAGKIKRPTKDNKHEVEFDDGDVRNIPEKNIIVKEWLSKGQCVLVTKEDGYSYPGIVIGYYKDEDDSGGYVVETDTDRDNETQRYTRGKVILNRDQAMMLVISSSGSATSSSEINLDNVVAGKRTRFMLSPDGSPSGRRVTARQTATNKDGQSPGTSRQLAKRKLMPARASPRSGSPVPKKGRVVGVSSPSTSGAPISPRRSSDTPVSPKRSSDAPISPRRSSDAPISPRRSSDAPISPRRSSDAPISPRRSSDAPISPMRSSDVPISPRRSSDAQISPKISPRRSPRKNPVAPSPSTSRCLTFDKSISMGPIPTNKTLFKGLAFLITYCSERKKKVMMFGRSPSFSTDESGVEEEQLEPIDKNYAAEQIKAGGGIVLSSFDKSQISKCKVYLISNAYCRTTKYLQALAAGIPCLSHLWLRDCIKQRTILGCEAYMLPAGLGLDDRTLLEQQPQRLILAGMHIYVISTRAGTQDEWCKVLIAAGVKVVKRLPRSAFKKMGKVALDCEVIVTDKSCPKPVLDKAIQLSIPIVSAEWLMQCLINSKRFAYKDSYKFAWDWVEPDPL